MHGLHGVVDPFVAALVDIALSAERAFVDLALGTLVDQGTSDAGKWPGGRVVFEEILTHFRAYGFEKEAQIADHGVVSTDGMPGLPQIQNPRNGSGGENPRGKEPTDAGSSGQNKKSQGTQPRQENMR